MEAVTVSPKYQVVIPKSIRSEMDIKPGEKVVMFEKDGIIHMIRIQSIKDLRGIFKGMSTDGLRDETERFT